MYTVTASPKAIRVRENGSTNEFSVRIVDGKVEFHQSLEGKSGKSIMSIQNKIKDLILNKVDKKNSYAQRFAKASKALKEAGALTFKQLDNRLQKVEQL